jgi:hypothetical protein
MTVLIIGMLVTLLIAAVVVAAVAVPAHREGRGLLTPEGEQLVQTARERTVEAVEAARDKVGSTVGDLAERLPVTRPGDEQAATPASPLPTEIDLRGDTADAARRRHRA